MTPSRKLAPAAPAIATRFAGEPDEGAPCPALEKHFTVDQVAEAWGVSPKTVRRIFQDMPGVLKLQGPSLLMKRRRSPRILLRIPESLLRRAHEDGTRGFAGKVQLRRG